MVIRNRANIKPTTIKIRRDTYDNWKTVHPILDEGEIAISFHGSETRMKIGKGNLRYNQLEFMSGTASESQIREIVEEFIKSEYGKDVLIQHLNPLFASREEIEVVTQKIEEIETEIGKVNDFVNDFDLNVTPVNGQVLQWNGKKWVPTHIMKIRKWEDEKE